MRRAATIVAIAAASIAATRAAVGGWAVITVEDLPGHLEVGTPATFAFTVRQHGREPLSGLSPTVVVRRADAGWLSRGRRERASEGAQSGRYEATIVPKDTGTVIVTIDASWRSAKVRLLPIKVVAPGAMPVALAHGDRGQQLFVAKGCVTCHVKQDDAALRGYEPIAVGPELTKRQFPVDWLRTKLADPAASRGRNSGTMGMPDLGLDDAEIAALVDYLNQRPSDATVATGQ